MPGDGVGCRQAVRGHVPRLGVDEVDCLPPLAGQPVIQCLHGLGGYNGFLLDQEGSQLGEQPACVDDAFLMGWLW